MQETYLCYSHYNLNFKPNYPDDNSEEEDTQFEQRNVTPLRVFDSPPLEIFSHFSQRMHFECVIFFLASFKRNLGFCEQKSSFTSATF